MITSLFTTALLILTAQVASLNAQELKRITMGYPSLAFTQSHIWVAKDKGYFENTVWKSIRFFCAAAR